MVQYKTFVLHTCICKHILLNVCTQYNMSTHATDVLISHGCHWGTQRESITTSAVVSLCKLFPLNYSSLTYLSARSWCAVQGFKYWIDFTSNNTGVRAKLHKVTVRQFMTHIQDVSAKLQQQRRIPLHVSASVPVSHCAVWEMVNSVRASHWICLPLIFSVLGFLTLYWWETRGRRGVRGMLPWYSRDPRVQGYSSNCSSGVKEILTFSDFFCTQTSL